MNVLSLFDGISAGRLALQRAGINVSTYYRAEIDKYANQVALHHYPNDVQLGDVTKWREWDIDWSSIDLVTGGFPCQAWSVAGKQLGDKDERGMLFWVTLDIIKHVLTHNPAAKWLMENVKMKRDFEQYITHHTEQALGKVEKTLINSALVSAQNRQRYYWTNFEVSQPDDEGVLLKDILEDGVTGQGAAIRGRYNEDGTISQRLELNGTEKTNTLTTVQKDNVVVYRPCELKPNSKPSEVGLWHVANATDIKDHEQRKRVYSADGKAPTLQTCGGGGHEPKIYYPEFKYRKLTPIECERLQTFPDNWTDCVSNTQRYKSLGNAWTVDVIAHILKYLPRPSRLSYETCPKVKDALIARRRACREQTGGGNLMLTFYITAALKAVIDDGATALLVAVADFNHTDIILLYDEEVADEIEKALHSRRRPVWLTLYTNDEFFGYDNDT